MYKRFVAIALSILMILSGIAPAIAESSTIPTVRRILSVAAIGSQLYLLDEEGRITTRTTESNDETLLGEVMLDSDDEERQEDSILLSQLYESEGKLYGFFQEDGNVYEIVNAQGEYALVKQELVLDTSGLVEIMDAHLYYLEVRNLFVQDGWLYFTGVNSIEQLQRTAGRISLTTGEYQAIKTESLIELAPYQEGKLLALIYDESEMYVGSDGTDNGAQIGILDPKSGVVENTVSLESEDTLAAAYISGIYYNEGQLYYQDSSRIMGMDLASSHKRISAYTGRSRHGGMSWRVCGTDDRYIFYGYDGAYPRKLDSESMKDGALMIYGEYGSEMHQTFARNYPDIPVDINSNMSSSLESLAQSMVSGNQMLDVLLLNVTAMPVDKLAQKGYCVDLSGYPEITSRVQGMYPQYRDLLLVDERLCGVPVTLYSSSFGVNMVAWEALGLSREDVPATMLELMDFVANWAYDYSDEFPELKLLERDEIDQVLFSCMLRQYMLYKEHAGEPLRFDTPEFRQLMDAYEQIDFEEFFASVQEDESYGSDSDPLFISNYTTGEFMRYITDEVMEMMPLSLFGEDDPLIWADMGVLVINSRTPRLDQSIAYLINYLDNLDRNSAYITLYPDHNEPLENPDYEPMVQIYTEYLENAKAFLEIAPEERQADAKGAVEMWENEIEWQEEYRYDASAEDIAGYRADIAPLLCILHSNPLFGGDGAEATEVTTLMAKYKGGVITSDQMIKDLDARLIMMEMED